MQYGLSILSACRGNRLLTGLANILFNAHISDLHTCLKLIPAPMLRDLNLSESGFGLDTEVTAMLLRCGIRPFEVPVTYYARSHAQGKKITWRDAFECVWILFGSVYGDVQIVPHPVKRKNDLANITVQCATWRSAGVGVTPASRTVAADTSPDGGTGRTVTSSEFSEE